MVTNGQQSLVFPGHPADTRGRADSEKNARPERKPMGFLTGLMHHAGWHVSQNKEPKMRKIKSVFFAILLFSAMDLYAEGNPVSAAPEIAFTIPLHAKYKITAEFGEIRHPLSGKTYFHSGIDFAAKLESDVYAAARGTVIATGFDKSDGNFIVISHPQGYQTVYSSLKTITCKVGDKVSSDSRIGLLGSTGMSTGPHLHFSVYKNGEVLDPQTVF